ncbi:hypothetical protein [Fischerella thermalis]|uniref:hypothetical protein n=1 Tax=Fischerella thermalis TaxID=372787 RepID=UPI00241EBF63|nr:hypothetical protein [Fischerella thermalis]
MTAQSCSSQQSHSSDRLSLVTPQIPPTPCPPVLVSTTTTVSTQQDRQIKPPVPVAIATEDFYTRVKEKTNKGDQQKVIQNYNRVISKNPRNINAYRTYAHSTNSWRSTLRKPLSRLRRLGGSIN